MDREVEDARVTAEPGQKSAYASGHLMCRSALWGIAGFAASAYFAWISFRHVAQNEYEWSHDPWNAATYIVWVILLVGLAFDTRCFRERLFFGVLVINFLIGCSLTFWRNVPLTDVRTGRIITGALWSLAALLSLTTLRGTPELRGDSNRNAA